MSGCTWNNRKALQKIVSAKIANQTGRDAGPLALTAVSGEIEDCLFNEAWTGSIKSLTPSPFLQKGARFSLAARTDGHFQLTEAEWPSIFQNRPPHTDPSIKLSSEECSRTFAEEGFSCRR